ncbi:flagellar hook-associated protein FlgK [Caulobacter sp. KR2-114]|uniref:flagellar hook-associated protein FlgK n=1 Tax=Caulobacter sp. KR2-114 TaxID=3400912 RepID=UPI003BFA9C4C
MSLNSILLTAGVALQNTQYQIATATENVANASQTGATQKTWENTSPASDWVALSQGQVVRAADAYLSRTVNSSAAASGASSAIASALQNYDSALGSVANGDDVSSLLTSFQTALSTLASSPSSAADKASVVTAAANLASGIGGLSSSIQTLRTQASSDIGTTVTAINSDLKTLQGLNAQIAAAGATGADTSSLLDQRDSALSDLSSKMGVQSYVNGAGQLVVYDQGGDQLLGDQAATLSYADNGQLGAGTSYPGAIGGIMVGGKDITGTVTTGALGGLIQLRDSLLPAQQDQLDQMASSLIATANTAANAGTAFPAPSSLASNATVSGSDAFSATGVVRIAVTSSSGAVISSTDLDLSAYSSVSDLLTGLNGISGVSASIDGSGKLTLQATGAGAGIALGGMTSSVGASGQSFSDYFGFNDLFTGDSAATIAVSPTLAADPSDLPTGTLSSASVLAAGASGVTASDASAITGLSGALTTARSVAADGTAKATTSTLTDLATNFVANAASVISAASSRSDSDASVLSAAQNALSNATGINVDQQTALLTQYQNQYEATAQLMASAKAMYATLISMMQA